MQKKPWSKIEVLDQIDAVSAVHEEQLLRALKIYDRDDEFGIRSSTVTRRPCGFLPMSNSHVRHATMHLMARALRSQRNEWERWAGRRTFLFTATFDDGIMPFNATEIPFYRIQRKVRSALQSIGLQGVGTFEVDVLKQADLHPKTQLLGHVHAVVWTTDPDFSPRAAERVLNGQRRFSNCLGVPAITIVSRAESFARLGVRLNKPQKDQTAASIMALGRYLAKPCTHRKKRFVRNDGTVGVMPSEKDFSARMALRLAEIFSQISPGDLVFAVGPDASQTAQEFKASMRTWERKNRNGTYLTADQIKLAWRRFLSATPKLAFEPSRVILRPADQ